MSTVTILDCTNPTELHCHYDGQSEPQGVYIELGLRDGTLLADYDSEVGSGHPFSVHYGFDRRYGIPVLTADAANRVMREIGPLAARILADWDEEWDGNNMVARLGEDAAAAEEEIEALLGEDPAGWADKDLVGLWDIDGAVNGHEAEEHGITAQTSDERLEEIERKILAGLAGVSENPVAVCHGLDTYLRGLRDKLIAEAADEDEDE